MEFSVMSLSVQPVFKAILFTLFSLFLSSAAVAKDLIINMAYLPKLAETPDKGYFVDLVKAMDEVYEDGKFKINVYPFPRSIKGVIDGKADVHIPMLDNGINGTENKPYRFASEEMGKVCSVIYSNKARPITTEKLEAAIKKHQQQKYFPFELETFRSVTQFYHFPVKAASKIKNSLTKVNLQRLDGALYMQEEGDFTVQKNKFKNIHRALFRCFRDVILIPKGKKGEEIDKIISGALIKLKETGKLQKLFSKIHKPYREWQPNEAFK